MFKRTAATAMFALVLALPLTAASATAAPLDSGSADSGSAQGASRAIQVLICEVQSFLAIGPMCGFPS
ncbi:hypothetical protein JGU71_03910 [Antrihabitans sp. YC3-6]|uniref:Secreted protein n=1 Tax=Antrihabitans stalagmiti TaxID=2799499 RepID=A0A934U143_9NOCA|nr:hypothetical protein [Antrihabitans stalagmiti]